MQNLWARVAQVRSTCKCSLCAPSSSGAFARRPTIGAPRQRGVKKGDLFFVLSSTIAFEAAVLDSVKKDARSKQWDKVIEEERGRVAAVKADQKRRINALLDDAERTAALSTIQEETESNQISHKVFFRAAKVPDRPVDRPGSVWYLIWKWDGVFSWASRCDELRTDAGFGDWKGVPLSLLRSLPAKEVDQLRQDTSLLSRYYGGSDCNDLTSVPTLSISTQKLRTLEWSVLKMSLRLLRSCASLQEASVEDPQLSETERVQARISDTKLVSNSLSWRFKLKEADEKLAILHDHDENSDIYETFEQPSFPNYEWKGEEHDEQIIELNSKLYSLLQQLQSGRDLPTVMSLVCQELLCTTTPPNIHAYNLLLVQLCRMRQKKLVWIVLDSMNEAHLRPNEITHSTLLRFFAMTDDIYSFCSYTKKMKGLKRGLALAHPDTKVHPLVKMQFHRFGAKMQRLAIVARMNQEVYTSLIVGMLRFFGSRDAMFWYRAMINDGWRPNAEILVNILRCCCIEKDWKGGLAVWHEFRKQVVKVTPVVYEWMLRLCRTCGREDIFTKVLSEGIRYGTLTARIRDLPLEIQMGDVDALLEQAENNKINQKGIENLSPAVRKHLQSWADRRGPHLVENTLWQARQAPAKLQAKLRALEKRALRSQDLRNATLAYQTRLNDISQEIEITVEETMHRVPAYKPSAASYTYSLRLRRTLPEWTPPLLLDSYQSLRKQTMSDMEQAGRQTLPFPEAAQVFNKPDDPRISSLDTWWSPYNLPGDKAEVSLEASA